MYDIGIVVKMILIKEINNVEGESLNILICMKLFIDFFVDL